MTSNPFSYDTVVSLDAPAAEPRFGGYPKYNFIGGHNDPTQIPAQALARAAATVLERDGSKLAMYGLGEGPMGYSGLRAFLANKLRDRRGIDANPDDILITTGSGQSVDLVNRILTRPGDTVLIEEFSYRTAINKARSYQANVIGMKMDHHGIVIEALAKQLADLKSKGVTPRYIYTIPTVQNPTGSILPLERRQALVELARAYGIAIFEDECYADLVWSQDAPPAIYSLAPKQVIHIGSFSKSLSPALRVGYAVADWAILGRMVALKTDGTGALDQMVAAEYFSTHFDDHIAALTTALRQKRDVMIDAVQQEFGTDAEITSPDGGIFLWLKLPDQVDVRRFSNAALDAGVAFNAGPEWACDGAAAQNYLRLCFALPSAAIIREGVAELARVCFEQTGVPQRGANKVRNISPKA